MLEALRRQEAPSTAVLITTDIKYRKKTGSTATAKTITT
jgi:hypothetical protein